MSCDILVQYLKMPLVYETEILGLMPWHNKLVSV